MRNETSFTAPTSKIYQVRLGFFAPERTVERDCGRNWFTYIAWRTSRRCAVREGDHVSEQFTWRNYRTKTDWSSSGHQNYSRLSLVVKFLPTTPSHVRATIHQSRAVIPHVLSARRRDQRHFVIDTVISSPAQSRDRVEANPQQKRRKKKGNPRTNVTTTKSLGFCFEDACLSAAHVNAARAVGSTVSEESNLPCKMKSTTTGSEEFLLRRSDRE